MPSEVDDGLRYNFQRQDEVLLDANIWLMLEGPSAPRPHPAINSYTKILEQLLIRESVVVISPLVLSEFVNRYARIFYDSWAERRSKNFKQYRCSEAFKPVADEIGRACKNILKNCQRSTRTALSVEVVQVLTDAFAQGTHDLNDLLIAEVCRQECLILVTHDADFAALDNLSIVTVNRQIL